MEEGSEVAVITFGQQATVNLDPLVVTETNRDGIHGRIPGKAGVDAKGCLECALREASRHISDAMRTKLIIVTSASDDNQNGVKRSLISLSKRSAHS